MSGMSRRMKLTGARWSRPKPRLSQSISAAVWPLLKVNPLLLLWALSVSAPETLHAHKEGLSLSFPEDRA